MTHIHEWTELQKKSFTTQEIDEADNEVYIYSWRRCPECEAIDGWWEKQ